MSWEPLALSFQVATAAALLALVFGVAIATLLTWRRLPGRELLDAVLTAPMVLPPTVLGYYVLVSLGSRSSLGQAWERLTGEPIVFTVTGAIVAATIGSLPLVIKAARAALQAVDPTLTAAARTLGAGPVRAFLTVTLRLAAPGIGTGVMLGFARALGDFGVTLMVAGDMPGRTQTAALAIYDAIQAGRDDDAAAMAALLAAIGIGVMYAVNRVVRRLGGRVDA
jgi:molybdate transport system permease protein